jgi:hypothetical protein
MDGWVLLIFSSDLSIWTYEDVCPFGVNVVALMVWSWRFQLLGPAYRVERIGRVEGG